MDPAVAGDVPPPPPIPAGEPDQLLVDRVRQGDAGALELIFRRYGRLLLDVVHGYLAASDESEELIQDLFLWIWEHRASWTVPGELRPYLLTAARNRALNRIRHRRVEERLAGRVQSESTPDPLSALTGDELAAVVARAIAELPPRCREVFRLIRQEELSHREVVALLGVSSKTIEIHMTRALSAIRAAVARWRGGEGG
jgi:RNA polymerase sigma-70 factor (ECF subfamily)